MTYKAPIEYTNLSHRTNMDPSSRSKHVLQASRYGWGIGIRCGGLEQREATLSLGNFAIPPSNYL